MPTTMLRDLLRQQPIRPFRVVMSSGEACAVRQPEMAWVTHNDICVGVNPADDGCPWRARSCPLRHVATVEPLATDARAEQA